MNLKIYLKHQIALAMKRVNSNIIGLVESNIRIRKKIQSEDTFFLWNFEPNRFGFRSAAHLVDFFQSQKFATFCVAEYQEPTLQFRFGVSGRLGVNATALSSHREPNVQHQLISCGKFQPG